MPSPRPLPAAQSARFVDCLPPQNHTPLHSHARPAHPPPSTPTTPEPSPFSHVSGMQVRFASLIAGLRALGDGVTVVTPCINPPATYHGASVVPVWGAPLPFYKSPTLLLSPGLSFRLAWAMLTKRPSLIHASSPGVLVYAAIAWAKLLDVPLVVSYHTHIPAYIPKYTWVGLVPVMWALIRAAVGAADLTLVPSGTMKAELAAHGCVGRRIEVWPQAVDTENFSPSHRSAAWHARLAGGGPDADGAVVLAYVGRLGAGES